MVGVHAKTAAVILLASLGSDDAREVLEDCLMDAHMDDRFKLSVIKILMDEGGFKPCWVDLGGELVRVTANGDIPGLGGGDFPARGQSKGKCKSRTEE